MMLPDNRFSITFEVEDIPGRPIIDRDTVLNKIFSVLSKEISIDVKYFIEQGIHVKIKNIQYPGLTREIIIISRDQNCNVTPIFSDDEAPKFWNCQS